LFNPRSGAKPSQSCLSAVSIKSVFLGDPLDDFQRISHGGNDERQSRTGRRVTTLQNIGRVPFYKALLSSQLYTTCGNAILMSGSNFSSCSRSTSWIQGLFGHVPITVHPPFSETKCTSNFKQQYTSHSHSLLAHNSMLVVSVILQQSICQYWITLGSAKHYPNCKLGTTSLEYISPDSASPPRQIDPKRLLRRFSNLHSLS
jgi:hypothetical protein